jgi:hypothetical protein
MNKASPTPAEYAAVLANLTATQERCNELLEEARAARRERDAYRLAGQLLQEELLLTRGLLEDAHNALAQAAKEAN